MTQPLIVMGRRIGTYDQWDQAGDSCLSFYDFVPDSDIEIPEGFLSFDYETGLFQSFDDAGEETFRTDAVAVLAKLTPNTGA